MRSMDTDYFLERAQDEIVNARQSSDPDAARAHFGLASLYLKRVHEGRGEAGARDLDRYIGAACAGRARSSSIFD